MRKITGLMMGVFFTFHFSFCTVINVPSDQPGIQAGIDASSDGDTVLVQPGTYIENINFNGHNITLGSMFIMTGDTGFISQTVINGSGYGNSPDPVVTFNSNETEAAKLTGLTIQGGAAENDGGGVYCYSASPTFAHLIIEENWAGLSCAWDGGGSGGGISLISSNSIIKYTVLKNNQTCGGWGWNGNGGGLSCVDSNPVLENVLIAGNYSGYGGGIFVDGSTLVMKNCTVADNDVDETVNAMAVLNSQVTILNSIFWGVNSLQDIDNNSQVSAFYSDLQYPLEGAGNISVDPFYADPGNGDYHLQPDSPCIDAGDPDMDGDGITWENDPDDRDPDGTRLDMGAFYFDQSGECPLPGDVSGDNHVDILDVVQVVDCILAGTDNCSCADLNSDGAIDVSDIVSMVEMILGG